MSEGVYLTIKAIKAANRAIGHHFFDPDTVRFFATRVLDGTYGGRYFVTSERNPSGVRRYTVRECLPSGACRTAEGRKFHEYDTPHAARMAAKAMADALPSA